MNSLIPEDPSLENTIHGEETDLNEIGDLTQQEIEAGLLILQNKLRAQQLPSVILIEDDEHDAELFKSALKSARIPIELRHFRDGLQAMDYFRGQGIFSDRERFPLPRLTVLDFTLSRGAGIEILRLIRNELQLKDLVIVAFTASNNREEVELARFLGINDWVNKPQSFTELSELVQRMARTWLGSAP
jgi:CheY-like chemotaxis protein